MVFANFNQVPVVRHVDQYVIVNGYWRPDAKALEVGNYSGPRSGEAHIQFPDSPPGARPVNFDDRVEIWLTRFMPNPIFRGFVSRLVDSTHGAAEYLCRDDRASLNDVEFTRDYNVPSPLTGALAERSSTWRIMRDGALLNRKHQVGRGNNQGVLRLSTQGFPRAFAGLQELTGQAVGLALQYLIEDMGGAMWRMGVKHYRTHSVLFFFKAGTGKRAEVFRGTHPALVPSLQPLGAAIVGDVRYAEDPSSVLNHIVASSRQRKVETCVDLEAAWDDTDEDLILQNWSMFTSKEIMGAVNPEYRLYAEDIGRKYNLPLIDDRWTDVNDVEHGVEGYPRVLSYLVQTHYSTGEQLRRFLLTKYTGDTEWNIDFEGFSINDEDGTVRLAPRFRKTVSYLLEGAKGNEGAGLFSVNPQYRDTNKDFNVLLEDPATNDYWLAFPSKKVSYKITARSGTDLTLEPVAGLIPSDIVNAPSSYVIFDNRDPVVDSGENGYFDGADDHVYHAHGLTPPPDSMIEDAHRGRFLITGTTFGGAQTDTLLSNRIKSNTAAGVITTYDTIVEGNQWWRIWDPRLGFIELPSEIKLNFAYQSSRRRQYDSGQQGNSKQDRLRSFEWQEFLWESKIDNAELAAAVDPTQTTVTFPGTTTNPVDDYDKMEEKALRRIRPTQEDEESHTYELPDCPPWFELGDVVVDNRRVTDESITAVHYTDLPGDARVGLQTSNR